MFVLIVHVYRKWIEYKGRVNESIPIYSNHWKPQLYIGSYKLSDYMSRKIHPFLPTEDAIVAESDVTKWIEAGKSLTKLSLSDEMSLNHSKIVIGSSHQPSDSTSVEKVDVSYEVYGFASRLDIHWKEATNTNSSMIKMFGLSQNECKPSTPPAMTYIFELNTNTYDMNTNKMIGYIPAGEYNHFCIATSKDITKDENTGKKTVKFEKQAAPNNVFKVTASPYMIKYLHTSGMTQMGNHESHLKRFPINSKQQFVVEFEMYKGQRLSYQDLKNVQIGMSNHPNCLVSEIDFDYKVTQSDEQPIGIQATEMQPIWMTDENKLLHMIFTLVFDFKTNLGTLDASPITNYPIYFRSLCISTDDGVTWTAQASKMVPHYDKKLEKTDLEKQHFIMLDESLSDFGASIIGIKGPFPNIPTPKGLSNDAPKELYTVNYHCNHGFDPENSIIGYGRIGIDSICQGTWTLDADCSSSIKHPTVLEPGIYDWICVNGIKQSFLSTPLIVTSQKWFDQHPTEYIDSKPENGAFVWSHMSKTVDGKQNIGQVRARYVIRTGIEVTVLGAQQSLPDGTFQFDQWANKKGKGIEVIEPGIIPVNNFLKIKFMQTKALLWVLRIVCAFAIMLGCVFWSRFFRELSYVVVRFYIVRFCVK